MVAKAFACWPALGFVSTLPALAQEQSAAEENSTGQLAKAAQNPIANLISVPFQFQSNFGVGPYHRPQGVLNFQPVVPIPINEDWNLITRWVTPFFIAAPTYTQRSSRIRAWRLESKFLSVACKARGRRDYLGHRPDLLAADRDGQESWQQPLGRRAQLRRLDDRGSMGGRHPREQHLVIRQHRQRRRRQSDAPSALRELQFSPWSESNFEPDHYGQLVSS